MISTKIFVGKFRAMLQRVLQETEDYSNDSASRTTNEMKYFEDESFDDEIRFI